MWKFKSNSAGFGSMNNRIFNPKYLRIPQFYELENYRQLYACVYFLNVRWTGMTFRSQNLFLVIHGDRFLLMSAWIWNYLKENVQIQEMMFFSSECWALRQERKKRLERSERAILLWMCNIKKKQCVSTNSLLSQLKLKTWIQC